MTEQEARTLISQLNNRSWAVRSSTRTDFMNRMATLRTVLTEANRVQSNGLVPASLRNALTTALANASNVSIEEATRYSQGLEPSQSPNVAAAAAAGARSQAGTTRSQQPPVITGGGNRMAAVPETTGRGPTEDVDGVFPSGKADTTGADWTAMFADERWQHVNANKTPGAGGSNGIMNWLNPTDREIYMRPWFLLAAAAAVGVIGYSIYSMYGEGQ